MGIKRPKNNSMKLTHYISLSVFLSALLLCTVANAQNLIPNGDFEQGPDSISYAWNWWGDTICGSADVVNGPDFWTVTNLSPDRLVESDPYFPTACRDTTFAQSGNAYILMGAEVVGNDESGKATLISPLETDSVYRLTYYISVQDFGNGTAAVEFQFSSGGNTIPSPIVTTTSWQYVDTVFTSSANSTEVEIVYASNIAGAFTGANIDNVMLVKESTIGISKEMGSTPKIKLYPNPSSGVFYVEGGQGANVVIYNAIGKEISKHKVPKETRPYRFDFADMPNGMYLIQVKTKQQIQVEKFLLTN